MQRRQVLPLRSSCGMPGHAVRTAGNGMHANLARMHAKCTPQVLANRWARHCGEMEDRHSREHACSAHPRY